MYLQKQTATLLSRKNNAFKLLIQQLNLLQDCFLQVQDRFWCDTIRLFERCINRQHITLQNHNRALICI